MLTRFTDRREAGQLLAKRLLRFASQPDVLVLALPRGGVPVGYEIAMQLNAPLDVFLVRKLGVPGHDEYAMGAMASGNVILLNKEVVRQLGISDRDVRSVIDRERVELDRREAAFGKSQKPISPGGRTVVLVDDGLATGATMKVAVQAIRQKDPRRIVVAVPVAPLSAIAEFEEVADEFVYVSAPETFYAVGQWYEDFAQTTDDEVRDLLQKATMRFHTSVPVTISPII